MPAVELTRLRTQINRLILRFDDPGGFLSALKDLLDLYSNRAYRPGTAVQPQPLLPSYRVAPLITRQLELELGKTCQEQPGQALEVVEALWRDTHLEPRLLAATLLGALPTSHGEGVLAKLRAWGQPEENFRMLDALFKNGTANLRRAAPAMLLALIEEWVTGTQLQNQVLGLRALVPLVEDEQFENLPPVFNMISPLVQNIPPRLYPDLYATLEVLARRSPLETAYFFRQVLPMAGGPATARLVRRCLTLFSPAQQASLRAALQAAGASSGQG
jgi:hypothetical protein